MRHDDSHALGVTGAAEIPRRINKSRMRRMPYSLTRSCESRTVQLDGDALVAMTSTFRDCRNHRSAMLRILGSPRKLCDGVTRRDFLHVGGLGALGLTLGDFWRLRAAQAATKSPAEKSASGFGKAKACILLFPYGSPPQHETFDPKPEAPVEIQGELKA